MTKIPETIKTIIWDLDGTILDSLGVLEDGLREILPKHDRELPSHEVMLANFHGSLDDSINNALGGDLEPDEIAGIIKDFLVVQDTYYENVEEHLYPDAVDLMRRAHDAGMRQIIVTNRSHAGRLKASPRSIVERSVLNGYIDAVICGDESEHRKPAPAVLGSMLATLVLKETLVIGDQHVDADFARNLGAQALLVSRIPSEKTRLTAYIKNLNVDVTVVDTLNSVDLV